MEWDCQHRLHIAEGKCIQLIIAETFANDLSRILVRIGFKAPPQAAVRKKMPCFGALALNLIARY
jgi:hypothetical protein